MKKSFKRFIVLLLVVCMTVGMYDSRYASAAGASKSQIVKSGGTKFYNEAGEEVSASALGQNGAVVGLSKEIEGTTLENEFDITLTVQTNLEQEKNWVIKTVPDSAVVLTIDVSLTMYNQQMNNQRYLAVAKEKALAFVEQYRETAKYEGTDEYSDAKRMLAIAVFDTEARVQLQWIDVNPKNCSEADWKKVTDTINNINVRSTSNSSNDVCTNFDGGLILTRNLLKQSSIDKAHSFAIIMSDGAPTVTVSGDTNTVGTISSTFYTGQGYQNAHAGGGWTHPKEVENNLTYLRGVANQANVTIMGLGDRMAEELFNYIITGKNNVTGVSNGSVPAELRGKKNAFDYVEPLKSKGYSGDAIMALDTGDWMSILASSVGGRYVSASNASGVQNAFDSIMSSIAQVNKEQTIVTTAWNATDPVSANSYTPYVEFLGFYSDASGYQFGDTAITNTPDGDTAAYTNGAISWDLKESTSVDTNNAHTYSMKYRVRLKNESADFETGKDYITNGVTTFTYQTVENNTFGEVKTGYFPIPEIEGYLGEINFVKVDENGKGLAGAEFTLVHKADCDCHDVNIKNVVKVSDENGNVSFKAIPSGHVYTLTETAAPKGYVNAGKSYNVVVAYGITTINGASTMGNVVNNSMGKLVISKDVTGVRTEEEFEAGAFTIEVTGPNGYSKELKLPVEKDGELEWSVTLNNLAAGQYSVKETAAAGTGNGYSVEASYMVHGASAQVGTIAVEDTKTSFLTVVNEYTYVPNGVEVTVAKVWDDANDQDGKRPDAVKFAMYVGEDKVQEIVVETPDAEDPNRFTAQFVYDAYKHSGEVRAEEIGHFIGDLYIPGMPEGYRATVSEDQLTITNTYVPEETEIVVQKVWGEGTEGKEQAVTVILKANDQEVGRKEISVPGEEETDLLENWNVTFENLPKFENGELIYYSVEEVALGENWYSEVTSEGNVWTVTNTYVEDVPEVTAHTVSKVWVDDNNRSGKRPSTIVVRLRQDGTNYGAPVVLNAANSWTYTWEDLPVDHVYTAYEVSVPSGYRASATSGVVQTILTNTLIVEEPTEPEESPTVIIPNERPPLADKVDLDDGTMTILDEEVPLAEAPKTGDTSTALIATIVMAGIGLLIMERKEKAEENE